MIHPPLVTVIIPAYNHEPFVEQAVRSVLNQTYHNIEIIIIDDGSTDQTTERIRDVIRSVDAARITFLAQENSGLPKALNRGLRLAKGQYVAFLASDDAYMPERIEEGVKALEGAGVDTPASYSDGYIMNEQGQRVSLFSSEYVVPIGRNTYKELLINNWIPALSVLYRKTILFECGLFDEQCNIEDYDILLRISKRYGRLHYISKPLFLYRRHSTNYSSNSEKMQEQYEQLLAKHPDMRRFRRFKNAMKSKDLAGMVRDATPLNVELSGREVVRRFQAHHSLINVGYPGLFGFLVKGVWRNIKRRIRVAALRARGVQVGKGVKIDGKVTVVGNPGNVILSDGVWILGNIRLISEYSIHRELIQIGCFTRIDDGATLYSHGGQVIVGDRCFVGPRVHIQAGGELRIGDDTMIAANSSMFASSHVVVDKDVPYRSQGERFEGISIGRNCWFGAACVVLDGTVIGDNCIIGAGCVLRGHYAADLKIVSRDALGTPLV